MSSCAIPYLFTGVSFEQKLSALRARSTSNARPDHRPQGAQPLPVPTPTSPEQRGSARQACSSPEQQLCLARKLPLEAFVQKVLRHAHMRVAGASDRHGLTGWPCCAAATTLSLHARAVNLQPGVHPPPRASIPGTPTAPVACLMESRFMPYNLSRCIASSRHASHAVIIEVGSILPFPTRPSK